MKPKPSQVEKNASRKAGSSQSQSRVRARADETVIIQITHEDGREWARVPFTRLEYSALQAVCRLRACTMKELFDAAVGAELARRASTPPPAARPGPPANDWRDISAVLAQGIEVGRELLKTLPHGGRVEARYRAWLNQNQRTAGILDAVSVLVEDQVDNEAARAGADALTTKAGKELQP